MTELSKHKNLCPFVKKTRLFKVLLFKNKTQTTNIFFIAGEGDSGDVWKVICSGDAWARSEPVGLKHVDTGAFLGASGRTFGRPIHGQMEIVGMTGPTSTTQWKAAEGIYVHTSNFDPTGGQSGRHDEL